MVTWDTRKLTDCGEILQGLTYSPDNVKSYGLLVLRSSNIQNEVLSFNDCVFVDCDVEDRKLVMKNDILICVRNGSSKLIGKCALIDQNYEATFGAFMSVLRSDMADYLFHLFRSEVVQKQIRGNSNATINQITKRDFEEIIVSIPPLQERLHIAKALSETDALLAAMEKLIAKKRDIKQGAMQELLTAKRRLPGFEGEFVKMNLVANSTLKARIGWQGLTTTEYQDSGYSYLITGTDFNSGKIMWDTCHYVDKHRFDQDTNIQVVNGDILITKDGTIGKVAIVNGLTKSATLNSGVFVLRSKGNAYDHRYVYYVLLSQIFIEFLDKLAAGSTINHLYQKDFMTFEFDVPPTLFEQTTIAEILSDMDAEIDALTAKLDKLRHIKQGMMNELLTGRIRLTDHEQVS